MIPESHRKVAEEIARSWQSGASNFVLVAPPLTQPEAVFQLLTDTNFLRSTQLGTQEIAIAQVPDSSFISSEQFVRCVCTSWQIEQLNHDVSDHLDLLSEATRVIFESGRRPILLLPKFHKAIEKLSWGLGARLRDLEHHYALSTVVELPVPLTRLRERWELLDNKEAFICSDFGQGHLMRVLGPMNESEIAKFIGEAGVTSDYIDELRTLSGGIPGLVKWLTIEAKGVARVEQLRADVFPGAIEQCRRFVSWLDAPEEIYFKERLARVYLGIASAEDTAVLNQHDWKKLLVDRHGKLLSQLIGYSCMELGQQGELSNLKKLIVDALSSREFDRALFIINQSPHSLKSNTLFVFYETLVKLLKYFSGISPNWTNLNQQIDNTIKLRAKLAGSQATEELFQSIEELQCFSETANEWNKLVAKNKDAGWRLGDCLCGRGSLQRTTQMRPSLQIVAYKLREAKTLGEKDHGAALKSILELPEQILQIYCSHVFNIDVWACPQLSDQVIDTVKRAWKGGDFKPPGIGTRMGYAHLLYIGWAMSQDLPSESKLFATFDDLDYWANRFDKLRNPTAHSITDSTPVQWIEYASRCEKLLSQLSQVLVQEIWEKLLPPVSERIQSAIRAGV